MIEFACRCNYRFSLPDDQAGGMVQCPQCKRLVDVPNLGDLDHIDADGSFKMDDGLIPLAEPDRLETLQKTFSKQRTDETGEEIDLRPSMQDIMQAGSEEIPLELADELRPGPPKYDPVTGELIRPIDIKPGEKRVNPAEVPMAQRAVEYASSVSAAGASLAGIAAELFSPVNLFVMSLIVLFHFVFQPVSLMMLAGIFLVAPIWIIGVGLLLAHYGNVIDETGPAERDELPRPLREVELYNDIWRPLTSVFGALILSYGLLVPALKLAAPVSVCIALIILGTFVLPALLLTLVAGGTLLNLRPDRVLGVIRATGLRYIVIIIVFVVALTLYALGLWRLHIDSARLFLPRSQSGFGGAIPWWFEPWLAYPALLVGVYLMHGFCWSLGRAYRDHRDDFPWVMQRHISTRLRDRTQLPPEFAQRRATANSAAVKQKLGT